MKVPGTDIIIQTIHYYKIGVRRYQNFGFLTWTNEEVSDGGGNYIQLALDPTYKVEFEKGGEWYEHTHWTFERTEVDGFVTIRLKTFPNTTMAVIFDPKTDTNHLVLLAGRPQVLYLYVQIYLPIIFTVPPQCDFKKRKIQILNWLILYIYFR